MIRYLLLALSFSFSLTAQHLKNGDKVGLIAPAFALKSHEIDKAVKHLKALGLIPVKAKDLAGHHGFFGGTIHKRVSDIHRFYADPEIKAIIAVRGGYGTAELVEALDYDLIQKHPKPLIGFSDITGLIHQIYTHLPNALLYHAPVGKTLDNAEAKSWFRQALMSKSKTWDISRPKDFDTKAKKDRSFIEFWSPNMPTSISGELIGGNLTLLTSMVGTSYLNRFKDKLVFIEAVGEQPYRIHRMLLQLIQGTDLLEAKGIIFGIFNDCVNRTAPHSFTTQEVIQQLFDQQSLPYYYGMPIGHIDQNASLPYGTFAKFHFSSRTLTVGN